MAVESLWATSRTLKHSVPRIFFRITYSKLLLRICFRRMISNRNPCKWSGSPLNQYAPYLKLLGAAWELLLMLLLPLLLLLRLNVSDLHAPQLCWPWKVSRRTQKSLVTASASLFRWAPRSQSQCTATKVAAVDLLKLPITLSVVSLSEWPSAHRAPAHLMSSIFFCVPLRCLTAIVS